MIRNKLKKQITRFPYNLQEMHDLAKVGKNYNRDLPKVSKMRITGSSKVRKSTYITCPKIVIVTSNLLYF